VDKKRLVIIAGVFLLIMLIIALSIKRVKIPLNIKSVVSNSASSLFNQAKELEKKNDLLNAREMYVKLVNEFTNSGEVMNWQKKIEDLNIKLLFSPVITPKSAVYEIKPADTLTKIAKEFKTTVDLIMKSNNLANDRILPGRKIKVWTSPFNILVDKSNNILLLKSDEEIIKTYIVATGKNNSTPIGTFKITTKLLNPTWFKAGAVVPPGSLENVLGTRWMGFDLAGYGIHGTTEPRSLGKQVTEGCVRMANPEVEELYTIVPVGTEVTIVD
jgi:lipoprotein-anchoring transpeptidase ErfK/SrfK